MKIKNIISVLLCGAFVLALASWCFFGPKATYSESERRTLAKFPETTWQNISSGKFATGFEEYRKEAYNLHASGYLTKPITVAKLKNELCNLRRPIPKRNRMRVQTFGNFEVFIDEKPVSFKYSKTKELLAYLVDRKGALCTIAEAQIVIFEDNRDHESYMKNLRRDLLEVLGNAGCGDVIAQQRGKLGIIPDLIDCDYYDWCDGRRMGIVWHGEYMAQYNWAEFTNGELNWGRGR